MNNDLKLNVDKQKDNIKHSKQRSKHIQETITKKSSLKLLWPNVKIKKGNEQSYI